MNLPRGKLIDTQKGGQEVLKKILIGLQGRDFNGYVKVETKRDSIDSHGILIVMGSRAVMGIHMWRTRLFGQSSLRFILRDSLEDRCNIKLFALPDEARAEMTLATHKFTSARIDMEKFDLDREAKLLIEQSFVPGEVAAMAQTSAVPSGPPPEEEAAALYKSMAEIGVDTTDLRKKEDELTAREKALRQEVKVTQTEVDRLKSEEKNFMKMDDMLNRLLKQREGERVEKEEVLQKRIDVLQEQMNRREKAIVGREGDIAKEIERLAKEKEEMRHREQKLLEMEKMFKRVLTNTEDRLKRKETEFLTKEQELERVVQQRMHELDEMRVQATLAGRAGEPGSAGMARVEEALHAREESLRKKEQELELKGQELRRALADVEAKKAVLQRLSERVNRYPEKELQQIFMALDELFDRLPEDVINRFANSQHFELYESLMARLGLVKK